jgi:Sigma-70, region 4
MQVKKLSAGDRKERALNHIHTHHKNADGWIALCKKMGEEFKQYHYKLSQINEEVIKEFLDGNFYFSQNTFYVPRRKVENIRQLRSLFVDVDCYTMGYSPEEIVYLIHTELKDKFPLPNRIIMSGQGCVPIWDIEPAPYMALPLWQTIIHYLVNIFKPYGADVHAIDAARVFRVDGSINYKNNKEVRILYIHDEKKRLDWWRDTYLPEIKKKKEKKKGRPKKVVSLFNAYSLHFYRLLDLVKLVELRKGEMEGLREITLFLYRYWSCNYCKDPVLALENALDLNKKFTKPLSEKEVREATKSAEKMFYKRMTEEERKKAREKGYPDAGYNYSNKKLIELLKITEEEQKHLSTIISKKEKQRRDTEKKREKRREQGVIPREEYLKQFQENKSKAIELKAKGMKYREIAEELGVSIDTVKGWFRKKKIKV